MTLTQFRNLSVGDRVRLVKQYSFQSGTDVWGKMYEPDFDKTHPPTVIPAGTEGQVTRKDSKDIRMTFEDDVGTNTFLNLIESDAKRFDLCD